MGRALPSVSTNVLNVVFRPSAFVQSQVDTYRAGALARMAISARLTVFYFFNLMLYAGPLTLAGFGVAAAATEPPAAFASLVGGVASDVDTAWQFTVALLRNSAYLLAASGLTFASFHGGVWLTRNSEGMLQTLHTVVYSTGIYLAMIFTLAWYLSTSSAVVVADEFLIAIQKEFVYVFIDAMDAGLALPGGRPDPVALDRITVFGRLALTGLCLAGLYYFYSLYLGARINHHTGRLDSVLAVMLVAASPAVYVVGSIAVFALLQAS